MGKLIIDGIEVGGSSSASSVKYNNTNSTLVSTNVQGAITELNESLSELNKNKISGFGETITITLPFTVPNDGIISIYAEPHVSDIAGYFEIAGILGNKQVLRVNAINGSSTSNTSPVKKGDNLSVKVGSGLKTILLTYTPFIMG